MTFKIEIPDGIEAQFQKVFGPDLSAAAKDALIINGYRTGRVSLGFVAEILGLSTRFEAQQWLADRGVPLNYDQQSLEEDRETNRKYFGSKV